MRGRAAPGLTGYRCGGGWREAGCTGCARSEPPGCCVRAPAAPTAGQPVPAARPSLRRPSHAAARSVAAAAPPACINVGREVTDKDALLVVHLTAPTCRKDPGIMPCMLWTSLTSWWRNQCSATKMPANAPPRCQAGPVDRKSGSAEHHQTAGASSKDLSKTHSFQRSSAAIAALSRYGAKLERHLARDVL